MLLTLALVCFGAQVLAWMLLPSGAEPARGAIPEGAPLEVGAA